MSSEPSVPVKIYHNPNCGTSRNTLDMIRQSGEMPEGCVSRSKRDDGLRLDDTPLIGEAKTIESCHLALSDKNGENLAHCGLAA